MRKEKRIFAFKEMSKSAKFIIVSLIIILLPLTIYFGILIKAALTGNKPVFGSRFRNDLSPAITNKMLTSAKKACQELKGVEAVDIELKTAQLRVNVDGNDQLSEADLKTLTQDIYKVINEIIPVSTYFTSSADKKMYDLAINVYNKISEQDFIYFILTKNAMMKEPTIQLVSKPLNEDLAKQLQNDGKDPSAKDKKEDKLTAEKQEEKTN